MGFLEILGNEGQNGDVWVYISVLDWQPSTSLTGFPTGKECDVPCVQKEEETLLEQEYALGAPIAPSDYAWEIVSRNSTLSMTLKNKVVIYTWKLHATLGQIFTTQKQFTFL